MDRNEAIKHLKVVLKTCDVQDEEAVEMAIKALEETHTLNGSTLTIKVSEEDIDKAKRIMLDYAPWCKVFYEDDKDINVPSKWIPVSERLPEKDGIYLVSGGGKVWSAQCLTFGCFRGWSNDARNPAVIAWMPLPEPWKGE